MKKIQILIIIFFTSCSPSKEDGQMHISPIDINVSQNSDFNILKSKKIYFGHMSVGYNIIDSLKVILPPDLNLRINETSDPKKFINPMFAHSQNGENGNPISKIYEFSRKINTGLGDKVDVAFFKFCYADINSTTDINKIFDIYKTEILKLENKYPNIIFLHVTVPLRIEDYDTFPKKIKYYLKKVIGKKTGVEFDNIQRMKFNNLLRQSYPNKLIDLALFESSTINGSEISSQLGGIQHQILLKKYSSDGGHLNKQEGTLIAKRFITRLVTLIK